jgi:hypothetical protein
MWTEKAGHGRLLLVTFLTRIRKETILLTLNTIGRIASLFRKPRFPKKRAAQRTARIMIFID